MNCSWKGLSKLSYIFQIKNYLICLRNVMGTTVYTLVLSLNTQISRHSFIIIQISIQYSNSKFLVIFMITF